jgi:hypothetical protein
MTSESVAEITPIVETAQDSALSKLVKDRRHTGKKVDLTNEQVESGNGTVYPSSVQNVVGHLTVKNRWKHAGPNATGVT